MNTTEAPRPVLGKIAISLSGGGYRAAAFHLGVFDLLERLDLLKDLRVLSTVSGGTFTGMSYAVSLVEGSSFESFYRKLYFFLRDTHVIKEALGKLSEKTAGDPMPSLIRSAADVYAGQNLLGDLRFGLLMSDQGKHFDGLVFNAVEFRTGNSFRFQTGTSARAIVGNGNLDVDKAVAQDIRLADIAAASSCFPSGFEPIRFPDDFSWPQGQTLDEIRRRLDPSFAEPLPLMDGGIYDNQGIDSVEMVYRHVDQSEPDSIGIFMISDTNQREEDLFDFPVRKRAGRLSLRSVVWAARLLFVLSLITSISLVANLSAEDNLSWPRIVFLYFIPFIFSLSIVIALPFVRARFRKALATVQEKTALELWPSLKILTIPELLELIDSRIKSLIVLTSSVFMKRLRDLGYKDINVYEKYRGKLVQNLIYSLNDGRFGDAIRKLKLEPTDELQRIATAAEAVPTNLWFTEEETLKNVIVCGQASTCFNLMKFLLKNRATELQDPNTAAFKLFAGASSLWDSLRKAPLSLLR